MRYDIFDFNHQMTTSEKAWRAAFLAVIIVVLILNIFYWGPA